MKRNTKMEIFYNKDLMAVFGMSQRQAIHWTERGLISSMIDARGIGSKRGYDFYGVYESGVVKSLFDMGLSFHIVHKIMRAFRREPHYFDIENQFEKFYRLKLKELVSETKEWKDKAAKHSSEEYLLHQLRGPRPVGTLLCYFTGDGFNKLIIEPYYLGDSLNKIDLAEGEVKKKYRSLLAVDLGSIWYHAWRETLKIGLRESDHDWEYDIDNE